MVLLDVNVMLYAHREDAADHEAYRTWLEELIHGPQAYGMADLVLSSYLRTATHSRIFDPPTPLDVALAFAEQIRHPPNRVAIAPGARHWEIFTRLCREAKCRGNLLQDAYLAALAIESGSEWITTDRDFSRFPGLRWRHPLE